MKSGAAQVNVSEVRILEGQFVINFLEPMDAWKEMELNFRKQIQREDNKKWKKQNSQSPG